MSTRIVSLRLPIEMIERIDDRCSDKECCRNDYIKSILERDLNRLEVQKIRVTEI